MNRRNFLATSGSAVTAMVGLAGCSSDDRESENPSEGPIVIRSSRGQQSRYGNVSVVGTAENVSDRTITLAQITAYFYDGSGARLGSGMDTINDLQPGRQWSFDAMYMGMDDDRVNSYDLSVSP